MSEIRFVFVSKICNSMIMIMNLYSTKAIEENSKALYIKLKLMNK